jgi:hypothetical protein
VSEETLRMRHRLEQVGKLTARRKLELQLLTAERQELIAKLRAEGVLLVECARLAKVSPEAIRIHDRRSEQRT